MTVDAALALLHDLPRYAGEADAAYKPGLERMHALLDAMGNPHEQLRCVHVAGTNGKGSVASMIAAIATAHGHRTGLHTSPHLAHVTERMRVDGTPAPPEWLAQAFAAHQSAIADIQPSFFEATVALSFRYFAEEAVDWAVIEVGLGGRLDATNVITPALALITTVSLEHTAILGDTLGAIAREKAGIIKPGVPVLSGVAPPEARAAIEAQAHAQDAPLHHLHDEVEWAAHAGDGLGTTFDCWTPLRHYERLRLPLSGPHQQMNAALAVRAAELLFDPPDETALRTGLDDVRKLAGLRGRFDVICSAPLVVMDVAHNAASIAATLSTVAPIIAGRGRRLHVLLGLLRDKDAASIARLLRAFNTTVTPLILSSERALSAEALRTRLDAHNVPTTPPATVARGIKAFLRNASPNDGLLVTGSHHVVSAVPDLLTL
ncbi:bifunctional folylpolyglutamate synthase/dihydrofolate synthase [Salisaeta longa]|uniref:bifunctional folylpolyglutamate synthase/dihydrofolate synthase n=1 Tax=Salisaeta longa TaxID=503170 RepID=UPI0003B525D9|nr:folylpolyglutamate synthase/dihydrofolate synthase family protein [Salisaeta longa]